jgi:outer membrane protein assembly factor BamB
MTAEWTISVPAAAPVSPVADAERVYLPLRSGELAALSLASGAVIWTVAAPDLVGSPDTGGGLVYLAYPRRVEARDVGTGEVRWRVETAGPVTAPLFWDNGWLLVVTGGGDAVMYRAATGEVLWRQSLGAPVHVRPAAGGSHIYALLDDGRVLALALDTGATDWEKKLPGVPTSIHPLDDRLFVGCRDRFLYCLAANDGKTKWRWRTGAAIVGTAVVDEESVYFLSLDGVLRALNRGSGSQRWKVPLPHQPTTGPFLSARLLLAPGISAEIPAYSTRDGKPSGSAKLGSEPAAPPRFIPAADAGKPGRLVVVIDDGRTQLLVPSLPVLRGTPLPGPPFSLPPTVVGERG